MDTTGGGGWGPIATTSLVGADNDPRTTIGSVNLAEFFLTVTVAASFLSILDAMGRLLWRQLQLRATAVWATISCV